MSSDEERHDPGMSALGGGIREPLPTGGPDGGPRTAPLVTPGDPELPEEGVETEVLVRDMLIFQVKLFLDGVKDIVLSPLAILAVVWDLIPSRKGYRGRTFYQVLRMGERFDLWLNLYTPAKEARTRGEGLLEAGAHSADSLVGKIEQLAREEAARQKRKAGAREAGGGGAGTPPR